MAESSLRPASARCGPPRPGRPRTTTLLPSRAGEIRPRTPTAVSQTQPSVKVGRVLARAGSRAGQASAAGQARNPGTRPSRGRSSRRAPRRRSSPSQALVDGLRVLRPARRRPNLAREGGDHTRREALPRGSGGTRRATAMRLAAWAGRAGGRRAGLAGGRGPPLARGGARWGAPLLASRGPPRAPARLALITWEIFFNLLLLGPRVPPGKSPS